MLERVECYVSAGHGEGPTVSTVRDGNIADTSEKVLEGMIVPNAAVNDDSSAVSRREKSRLVRDAREKNPVGLGHKVLVRDQLKKCGSATHPDGARGTGWIIQTP